MRLLGKQEIEDIALGATVLGTGGGGDPYIGKLMALQAIEEFGPIKLLTVDEISDDALVVPTGMMGAPVVVFEKPPSVEMASVPLKTLENYFGKEITATMPIEAGGLNSMIPLAIAARLQLPVIDVDGIGRAFPELQLTTFYLDGISATPMTIADEKGNVTLLNTVDNVWAERIGRNITSEMGASVMMAIYPMVGKDLKKSGVHNILQFEEEIGRAIRIAKTKGYNSIDKVLEITNGFELFKGKVTDIHRKTEKGWVFGTATMEGLNEYKGENLHLRFQNEHLLAQTNEKLLCVTPDLIAVLDAETGTPITTEGLRYGARCVVIGIPCHPKWRTEMGIAAAGPSHFGYEVSYVPVENLVKKGAFSK